VNENERYLDDLSLLMRLVDVAASIDWTDLDDPESPWYDDSDWVADDDEDDE
jgi:hypothetical protein